MYLLILLHRCPIRRLIEKINVEDYFFVVVVLFFFFFFFFSLFFLFFLFSFFWGDLEGKLEVALLQSLCLTSNSASTQEAGLSQCSLMLKKPTFVGRIDIRLSYIATLLLSKMRAVVSLSYKVKILLFRPREYRRKQS